MTYRQYRFSFGYGLTPVVKKLMIIIGAVFLLQRMNVELNYNIEVFLGLVPYWVWTKFYLWQLVTYIFVHGSITHILFNLLAFWMFGGELENFWGSKEFLFYFFFCGIGAGICTVLFSPNQSIPVIGASGAIWGLLLAFGWLFPNRIIYFNFLFPIPAKYFVIIFGLVEFFASWGGPGGGVAHLTHLGGLFFGILYMAYPVIRRKIRRERYRRKLSQKDPDGGYYH